MSGCRLPRADGLRAKCAMRGRPGWRFLVCALLVASCSWLDRGAAAGDTPRVELLEYPYPYSAAFTILSDLHATTVAEFEAVHRLVNTNDVISQGDPAWRTLRMDNWAPAQGRAAVAGFGFPFADSFLFYDRAFGWFKDYDEQQKRFIPDAAGELETKFRAWDEKGFIGPIHTFGVGPITRAKASAAVDYLLGHGIHVRVWVNHSKSVTPSGVGDVCCTLLNQVLVDARYRAFRLLGRSGLVEPDELPGGRARLGYIEFVAAGGLLCVSILVFLSNGRHRRPLGAAFAIAGVALVGLLQVQKVDFYQGDDPGSPYYNLDQIRRLGVRYFWTVTTDYWQATTRDIVLPEAPAATGRPSMFRVHQFNDGSKGLMFLRNTVGGGPRTMGLITPENLERLIDQHGHAILYLHWLTHPTAYFDAAGVEALESLARARDRIWIASAGDLLDQAYAYSYLQYTVTESSGGAVVDLTGFDDPIEGHLPVTPDRVRNISFRCRRCADLTIQIGGRPLAAGDVSLTRVGIDVVATLRSADGSPAGAPDAVNTRRGQPSASSTW